MSWRAGGVSTTLGMSPATGRAKLGTHPVAPGSAAPTRSDGFLTVGLTRRLDRSRCSICQCPIVGAGGW